MLDGTSLLSDYLFCRYKAFLKLKDEQGEVSEYEKLQIELNREHRQRAIASLTASRPPSHIIQNPQSLKTAVRRSGRIVLEATDFKALTPWKFDAIEILESTASGTVERICPIRFFNSSKLSVHEKVIAAADGLALAPIVGHPVDQVQIMHGADLAIAKVTISGKSGLTNAAKTAQSALAALDVMKNVSAVEPSLVLNSHCEICEFKRRCRAEAERRDDLSLLRGLHRKDIESLNNRGVFTVTQLAYTCRAKSIARSKSSSKKHSIPLQAMAIRDKIVYVRQKPEVPASPVKIYLDVEGIPERPLFYLIGLLIDRGDSVESHQFWADTEADEEIIWQSLCQKLIEAGDCPIFHFGSYDLSFIDQMVSKYTCRAGDGLRARCHDVLAMIRTNIYFPVHSNSLKQIGGFLGASWSGPIKTGLESLVWRFRWERSREPRHKNDLLHYNMEDCIVLRILVGFISDLDGSNQVKATDEIPATSGFSFGSHRYAIPELARFTKCAYFEYQRDKIHFRTDKRIRRSQQRKRQSASRKSQINQRVECAALKICPKCGSDRITIFRRERPKKIIQELKFTARGVKRWEVKYTTFRYQCLACRHSCYSNEYPTNGMRLGYTVAAWSAYQQIVLRQTGYAIADCIRDLFGISITNVMPTRLRRSLAEYHKETETHLLNRLRNGDFVCADEAKIEIKKKTGYVWVFSNTEEVIYRFSPTREASVLEEVLSGFNGVLVSDFYGAYDSPMFKQQKCLIHLIRDINDDLLKSPFNVELKGLAERFTELLKLIIDAIDKYGLKQRHLKKFMPNSTRFLDWIGKSNLQTDVARGYQKRFQKHGPRLFTFLTCDGVPWNNNLAENAVKLIASRRSTLGVSFSEGGIQDYLRLLSIYQTLRRKGGSFLHFLLSKKTDLFEFLGE